MRRRRLVRRNERGATLALVAVSLTAILGMGALAVDLGMLMKARADGTDQAPASRGDMPSTSCRYWATNRK